MAADAWYEKVGDFVVGLRDPVKRSLRVHRRKMERDGDYRNAFDVAARLRGYKSAGHTKNQTPWMNASNRSADGEILTDLPTMRNRSRALNRDDALASGIYSTLTRGVVGTGLRPQACTGEDFKDDALEAVWKSRCDRLALGEGAQEHGAHQRLAYGKRSEDGEIFLTPAVAGPGEALWIEAIEAERVCSPLDAVPLDPKGRISDGVEKDQYGRVVAYWVLKMHPGDINFTTLQTRLGRDAPRLSPFTRSSFVRLDESRVRHDRSRVTRPGQTRGVPICHAILQDLRDLDLLILASLKKTQIAACLAVFLKSDASSTDLIQMTAEDYGYQLDQKIEPGMMFRQLPGEEAQFLTPQAGGAPELDKFVFLLARRIGAAVGLSPQAVLRAWETLSYSAARTVKIDDRQTYRAERQDFSGTLTWEWKIVMEDELLRGNEVLHAAGVTMDDIEKVLWIGDEESWVDPLADAQTVQLMLQLGLTNVQIECAKLGRDWQEVLKGKLAAEALEIKERARLKLPAAQSPTSLPPPALKILPGAPSSGDANAVSARPGSAPESAPVKEAA